MDTQENKPMKSKTSEWLSWIKSMATAVVIVLLLNHFVFAFSIVEGSSMKPTLKTGERLFVNKFVYLYKNPQRRDVIILQDPSADRYLVKRVVAVAGDEVEIRRQQLYVNGKPVNEKYIDSVIEDGDYGPIKVQPGTVFVMGDNRHFQASMDSRDERVGLIPLTLVDGRVDFVIWPATDFRQFVSE